MDTLEIKNVKLMSFQFLYDNIVYIMYYLHMFVCPKNVTKNDCDVVPLCDTWWHTIVAWIKIPKRSVWLLIMCYEFTKETILVRIARLPSHTPSQSGGKSHKYRCERRSIVLMAQSLIWMCTPSFKREKRALFILCRMLGKTAWNL